MVTPQQSCSSSTSCGANCGSTPSHYSAKSVLPCKLSPPSKQFLHRKAASQVRPHPATRYVTLPLLCRVCGEHRFAQITAASGICECEQLQQHSGRLDPSTRAPFAKKQVPCLVMHHQGRGLQLLQPRSIHLEIAGFAAIFPEAAARS